MIHYPREGQSAITTLRVSLCILPGVILFAGVMVASKLGDLWPLAILPIPVLVMFIGYFEGQLALRQNQIDPSNQHWRLVRWAVLFLILQLVIAPMFCVVTFFGYSVISGYLKP